MHHEDNSVRSDKKNVQADHCCNDIGANIDDDLSRDENDVLD